MARAKNERLKKGFVLWFTGLSGAGKSTLSHAVATVLAERGLAHEMLDGDVIRTNLSQGLGFSKEDRDTNVRRIGFVARLLARNGVIAFVAAISPYVALRDEIRSAVEADGAAFVEVFVDCDMEVLIERDTKGLYKKALAGEIDRFTGVSDPYERPEKPDIQVRTDREELETSVAHVIARLDEMGLLETLR